VLFPGQWYFTLERDGRRCFAKDAVRYKYTGWEDRSNARCRSVRKFTKSTWAAAWTMNCLKTTCILMARGN